GELDGDVDCGVDLERAGGEDVGEGLPFDEGHGEEDLAFDLVDFVDSTDVGVLKAGGGLRFAEEAFAFIVAEGALAEEFEGDGAAELEVLCLVDDPHSAFPDFFENAVMRYYAADHGGLRLRDPAKHAGAFPLYGA